MGRLAKYSSENLLNVHLPCKRTIRTETSARLKTSIAPVNIPKKITVSENQSYFHGGGFVRLISDTVRVEFIDLSDIECSKEVWSG